MAYSRFQEFMAELFGTMVLILFGCGSVAMVVLWPNLGPVAHGGYTDIVLGWGLAVTFGIYISGTISGAHLNPAVSLALAMTGRFPWAKLPHYIAGQFAGAFIGAAIVFLVYYAQWIHVDPALDHTTGVFSTFPAQPGFWPGFIDQVVGTAILLGLILAVGDKFSINPPTNLAPIVIGLLVLAIGISWGGMQGYAINPARDLGPRLFAVVAGFKNNGLTDGTGIWLPPVLGPIVGGPLGAIIYDVFIGRPLAAANKSSHRAAGMDPNYVEPGMGGQDLAAPVDAVQTKRPVAV
ncbi:MIP/aquaporin family protein [Rhizosaccharibacter radicis]|uniref:Aquaporin family protein n=1 Tax=Rhizosaccharibacter radicis TaxID=2782605 RepID=A0ABT1VW95_9PROT|nr:aquaporin family protein [Acetobacteraceae bacterium KSS12]